jgi:hypothetical protein
MDWTPKAIIMKGIATAKDSPNISPETHLQRPTILTRFRILGKRGDAESEEG